MELRDGNEAAVDELFALLYDELRLLAHRQRQRWQDDDTLDTTGLLHEAFLKLVGRTGNGVEDQAHFFALASRVMRQVLCNYARDRRALKRGGALQRLPLDEALAHPVPLDAVGDSSETLLALDEALTRLEQVDPRRSKVVECRFFGGLSIDETAAAIGISPKTVKRDWTVAQAWLHREMSKSA